MNKNSILDYVKNVTNKRRVILIFAFIIIGLITLLTVINSKAIVIMAPNRTLYNNQSQIKYWQTYSLSPRVGIHEYVDGKYKFEVETLPAISQNFRTGYAFIRDGKIIFEDRGNAEHFEMSDDNKIKKIKWSRKPSYSTDTYVFQANTKLGVIRACLKLGTEICKDISIKPGSFPYVYAEKNGAVITITNYGDALLFKNSQWCRMGMVDDVYSCDFRELEPLNKPREVQFYSSINYRGNVLLGEWPTGRLYEFDGQSLFPSQMTPSFINSKAKQKLGYEAQSMAEYCGDLFVGYWPKGELWRYDNQTAEWSLFQRFFSDEGGEAFIPYSNREDTTLDSAFFGQRIAALIPFNQSLYAVTSNLRDWKESHIIPDSIPEDKVNEYGRVYKITRYGCISSYLK